MGLIDTTLKKLNRIAKKFEREGYFKASAFIAKDARLMVTFAKLTLEDVTTPQTSSSA